jgi:hypothetical protein
MATNLRLRPDAEQALRDEAARTGRSQQEILREAVDVYLGLHESRPARTEADVLIAGRVVLPPRRPFAESEELAELGPGTSTLDLLERDDRV